MDETRKTKKIGGGPPPAETSYKKRHSFARKYSTYHRKSGAYQPNEEFFQRNRMPSIKEPYHKKRMSIIKNLDTFKNRPTKPENTYPKKVIERKQKREYVDVGAAIMGKKKKKKTSKRTSKKRLFIMLLLLFVAGLSTILGIVVVSPMVDNPCSFSGEPTELQLIQCKRYTDGHECTFDVSQCGVGCVLGYESDEYWCPISCNCATRGTFETDISFSEISAPSVLTSYTNEEDSRFGDDTPGSVSIYQNLWDLDLVNGRVRVPYILTSGFLARPSAVAAMEKAIAGYSKLTCVDLVPRTTEKDFIEVFGDRTGCSSFIGRVGGRQAMSIAEGCERIGTIQHEFMHALGFYHEQSRPDRDDFIVVNYENINPSLKFNFRKRSLQSVRGFSSPYDTGSVMHYGGYSFSTNSQPTILEKISGQVVTAQRVGMSKEDIIEINALYLCPHATDTTVAQTGDNWADWSKWYPCSASCGEGRATRMRECQDASGEFVYGGRCPGPTNEFRSCDGGECEAKAWGQWSTCTATCGGGTRHRYSCCYPKSASQRETCGKTPCSDGEVAKWSEWTAWGLCSRSCGTGWRRRTRTCIDVLQAVANIRFCPWKLPSYVDMNTCSIDPCPNDQDAVVILNWEQWQNWGSCSASCGLGARVRYRQCPAGGVCRGDSDQLQGCKLRNCAADTDDAIAAWGPWSGLSLCSAACGGGIATRVRYCYGQNYEIVGTCLGIGTDVSQESETVNCNEQACPAPSGKLRTGRMDNGLSYADLYSGSSNDTSPHWSPWASWSRCSVTCGFGAETRRRICLFGQVGEKGCVDSWMERRPCDAGECNNRGLWGNWQDWSACSKTCNGTRMRNRICFIEDRVDLSACAGSSEEMDICNAEICHTAKYNDTGQRWDNRSSLCDDGFLGRVDVNGDRMDDLICVRGHNKITLIISQWDGSLLVMNDVTTKLCVTTPGELLFADFNGDGAGDVMCFDKANRNSRITFAKHGSFFDAEYYDWAFASFCVDPTSEITTARLNDDFKTDLLCIAADGLMTALLNEF